MSAFASYRRRLWSLFFRKTYAIACNDGACRCVTGYAMADISCQIPSRLNGGVETTFRDIELLEPKAVIDRIERSPSHRDYPIMVEKVLQTMKRQPLQGTVIRPYTPDIGSFYLNTPDARQDEWERKNIWFAGRIFQNGFKLYIEGLVWDEGALKHYMSFRECHEDFDRNDRLAVQCVDWQSNTQLFDATSQRPVVALPHDPPKLSCGS